MTEPDNTKKFTKFIFILWATGIVALGLIAITFIAYRCQFNGGISTEQSLWGQFGDYFGGALNPILSFITIVILLVTLHLQKEELKAARDELKQTSKALNSQNDIIKQQMFENSYYKLLEYFENNFSYFKGNTPSSPKLTSNLFYWIYTNFNNSTIKNDHENFIQYTNRTQSQQIFISNYIKTLYQICCLFEISSPNNEPFFINGIFGRISNEEFILLYLLIADKVEYIELFNKYNIFYSVKNTIKKEFPLIFDLHEKNLSSIKNKIS